MPHIQKLSPHVADLIAAGEVVERPASVVKELIENSIDAGATAVAVEIAGGGMASVRVTDNGCGIAPEELPTAFLRHATSKLHGAEDLRAIGTLGFRGEALAAIAAVSRLDVFTRERGAELGASLSLEGGVPGGIEPAGCPEGTTIVVRDLFYNTPARQKFMRSDAAEAAAVSAAAGQIALSRPEVSLRYLRDGREELHTPGDGRLLSAIYAARGREFANALVPVEGGGEGVRVRGYVTEPLAGRGSRSMQSFFCCGRLIKSPLLTAALEEAYANRQMKGRFPGCVLHVDLPLDQVDVNVHPAKTVVKFVSERTVFAAVCHAVKDALDARDVPATAGAREPAYAAPASPVKTAPAGGGFYRTMDAASFRQSAGTAERRRPRSPELSGRLTLRDSSPASPFDRAGSRSAASPAASPRNAASPRSGSAASPEVPEQTSLTAPAARPWRYAGEVLKTYIICEDGDDVWLIDKHAAHERINFDRLKNAREPAMRQQLILSETVDLPPEQCSALLERAALLEEFGFELEDFGPGTLLVRAIPSDMDASRVRETLEALSGELLTCGGAESASARDAMLRTMACKASIRGGDASDPEELKALIARVQSGEIRYCPHGRPVKVKLNKYDIEKLFRRA